MQKIILLYFIYLLSSPIFGQTKPIINEPYVGLPWRRTEIRAIDPLNELPDRITYIINNLFQSSMTDFVDHIVFMKGQVIDLEQWASKDSAFQIEYKFVVPKYELFFELRDTSIGVESYCFRLGLDQYGQIIRFDWPREGFGKKSAFTQPSQLEKTAYAYAKKKKYKTESCLYSLNFDESEQRLYWNFSYIQKSTGDEYNYSKEYITVVVDAIDNLVIMEQEMMSVGQSD